MSVTFAFGCICGNIDLTQKFAGNELVFKARILKIHPNSSPQESYYKVDLEYLEGFKGTSVETIFVYGSTDGNIRSSCDIFLNENSIIIFFANKIDDRIVLDPCHGHIENDFILKSLDKKKRIKEFDASVVRTLKVLRKLEKKRISKKYGMVYYTFFSTDSLSITNPKSSYSLYEIAFDANYKIKKVKTKISFKTKKASRQVKEMLKGIIWSKNSLQTNNGKNLKFLVGAYFWDEISFFH